MGSKSYSGTVDHTFADTGQDDLDRTDPTYSSMHRVIASSSCMRDDLCTVLYLITFAMTMLPRHPFPLRDPHCPENRLHHRLRPRFNSSHSHSCIPSSIATLLLLRSSRHITITSSFILPSSLLRATSPIFRSIRPRLAFQSLTSNRPFSVSPTMGKERIAIIGSGNWSVYSHQSRMIPADRLGARRSPESPDRTPRSTRTCSRRKSRFGYLRKTYVLIID